MNPQNSVASNQATTVASKPSVQVLVPGKRRIVGATKFGPDGCGY